MESLSGWQQALSIATLQRTRQQLRSRRGFALVASISATFALISMLVGLMVVFDPEPGPYFVMIVQPGASSQWWNYPGVLAVQPWGVLALPLWATISMALVSVGVGLGMSIAVLLGIQLVRFRRTAPKGPAATGLAGALTPAMIALVTLGACCSTNAVSLASLGATAQVTGTTVDNLLFDSWYLPLFQLIVLWIALVAQEQLVRVYGPVIGLTPAPTARLETTTRFASLTLRSSAAVVARVALIIAGTTWGLALLAEWTLPVPPACSGAMWFQAVIQHVIPATAALLVGLFPAEISRALRGLAGSVSRGMLRALVGVSGASLLAWTPATVASWGVHGFVNGALGELGLPPSWGAVAPAIAGAGGWALLLLQYLT
ncbi:MAG TPA: hypothetical protein VGS18_01465, partial [Thermoplasmata archaeon]|nr:hypothetical protein [Thermoplasmata archaeon]